MTVQFNYVHKRDGNGNKTLNLNRPYEAYTVVTNGLDVGPDNVTGTADDRTIQVYSVPSTYPNFNVAADHIVQAEGKARYHALGVTFNKQYSNNYSFLVSYTADYRDLDNDAPRNPNEELWGSGTGAGGTGSYAFAVDSWNHSFRMSGNYSLPWGLTYAASYLAQSGDYYFREVQIRDGNNTNVAIRVDPKAGRYAWTHIWDNRVSKRIKTWGNQSIEGEFNVYNTLNVNTITSQNNRVGATTFLQPTEIIAPRIMRVGVKYRF
jgi:hypothetical protein